MATGSAHVEDSSQLLKLTGETAKHSQKQGQKQGSGGVEEGPLVIP